MTAPDSAAHWEPPTPQVTFIVFKGRWRYKAYVNSVGIWAKQSQRRYRGITEEEALEKAKAAARRDYPDAIVPDKPKVSYL